MREAAQARELCAEEGRAVVDRAQRKAYNANVHNGGDMAESKIVTLRIANLDEVETYVERIFKETGLRISRSVALRKLIDAGLAAVAKRGRK